MGTVRFEMISLTRVLLTAALCLIMSAFSAYPASLKDVVLEAQIIALQAEIKALKREVATIKASSAMALTPFVSVDPSPENGVPGPNIHIHGANVHIESGSGSTNDNGGPTVGLGNLIIGYDEATTEDHGIYAFDNLTSRHGSHNLIMGRYNNWGQPDSPSYGGLVGGEGNSIFAAESVILTGSGNYIPAGGMFDAVITGDENLAIGSSNVIVSGLEGVTEGGMNALLGGYDCYVTGNESTNLGGFGADRQETSNASFRVETWGTPSLWTYTLDNVAQPFTVNPPLTLKTAAVRP